MEGENKQGYEKRHGESSEKSVQKSDGEKDDESALHDFCDSFDSEICSGKRVVEEVKNENCSSKAVMLKSNDFGFGKREYIFEKWSYELGKSKAKVLKRNDTLPEDIKSTTTSTKSQLQRRRRIKSKTIRQFNHVSIDPTKQTGTYVCNGRVYCFEHKETAQYWCTNCRISRCEKCVNIMHSRTCINHKLTTLQTHMVNTKAMQQKCIDEKSAKCLQTVDLLLKYIHCDQKKIELQALFQKERIRQEFVSFHQLLADEEQLITRDLNKNLEKYNSVNQCIEEECGKLIADEAELMCKSLESLELEDPYGTSVEDVTCLIKREWNSLSRRVKELPGLLQTCPDIVGSNISFTNMKKMVKQRLQEVCEPVKVVPIAFTVYLDGDLIFLPIKLSDLFACSNNGHIDDVSCLLFEVKIYSYRQLLQKLILKYDDYICNLLDKLHLTIGKRYRVHAKVVSSFNQLEQWKTPCCNVLIVTGYRSKDTRPSYLDVNYINNIRQNFGIRCKSVYHVPFMSSHESDIFCKLVNSKMWLFTSVSGCKGFFDISPEEMKLLAYSVNRQIYDVIDAQLKRDFLQLCNHAEYTHENFLFDKKLE